MLIDLVAQLRAIKLPLIAQSEPSENDAQLLELQLLHASLALLLALALAVLVLVGLGPQELTLLELDLQRCEILSLWCYVGRASGSLRQDQFLFLGGLGGPIVHAEQRAFSK